MAERSFAREVQDLKLGEGEEFRGEGILAITKALLQSGVSYVGGYQGAPISHLMDVLADAKDVLDDLGVHFENSASEAAAAATLAASVMYPIRGAVTLYNSVMRALQQLGLADVYGETSVPIYCLNVTYPLIDDEVAAFAMNKKAILMVEEGQPEFIEQALNTILRRRDIQTKINGKDVLPMAGEYTPQVVVKGVKAFLELYAKNVLGNAPPPPDASEVLANPKIKELAKTVPPRPPTFLHR